MWHGATLLREHRGDGHIAALLHAGLTGLEALVTHTATGRGFTQPAAQATRGWRDEEWAAACAALADRGLLDDGGLTEDGAALRAASRRETDALSAAPWLLLGARAHRAGRRTRQGPRPPAGRGRRVRGRDLRRRAERGGVPRPGDGGSGQAACHHGRRPPRRSGRPRAGGRATHAQRTSQYRSRGPPA